MPAGQFPLTIAGFWARWYRRRAEARRDGSPYTKRQAWVINEIELMSRKSIQIAKVQPATMAKLAFNTLVIAGFIILSPDCPFSLYRRSARY